MTPETETALAAQGLDLTVLEGIKFTGGVNTEQARIIANVEQNIRRGVPQVQPQGLSSDRVLMVGGGPSLDDTLDELVELYMQGAKIVALNGGYGWCLRHHLKVSAAIVVDARPNQGHFLQPAVPNCRYLIASQCDPTTWDAIDDGRAGVWIWHAEDGESTLKPTLDAYYFGRWHGIGGGTTVAMRGLTLLRTLGFFRFDLFGIDSCCREKQHHAFEQAQNDKDEITRFEAWPKGFPERKRAFYVTPWMLKQLEDFLQLIRIAGDNFLISVHGDGLLAYALQQAAEIEYADPAKEEKTV